MKNLFVVVILLAWLAAPAGAVLGEERPASKPGDSVAELRDLAEKGEAWAQVRLGFQYAAGDGVPQDYKEAARLYRLAAEQGNAIAQTFLGVAYAKGRGVPQDDKEAARWYRLAAEQGLSPAQTNLGFLYYKGKGVPQDYVQAHMWLNLAAAQEDKDATTLRDFLAERMTSSQIEEAQRLAREWKPKK